MDIYASPCDSVIERHCVILIGDQIEYSGPIENAPKGAAVGKHVLLNPADYHLLRFLLDRMDSLRLARPGS